MPGPGSPETRLKAKALACIAQREHSRVELRAKLIAYLDRQRRAAAAAGAESSPAADMDDGERETVVEALLDWLVERDLLSTERFVEGRVRVRAARFGQRRVQQELAHHGLALDADTQRQLCQSEPARAQALWSRRFGAVAADPAQRARQMRFLLARGFDADVARRVVAGTIKRLDEEADAGNDGER